MTTEQIELYRKAAELGSIRDELNPIFLLRGTHTHLLWRIINRDFDVVELAKMEMRSRGLGAVVDQLDSEKAERKKAIRKPVAKRKGRRM